MSSHEKSPHNEKKNAHLGFRFRYPHITGPVRLVSTSVIYASIAGDTVIIHSERATDNTFYFSDSASSWKLPKEMRL